MFCAVKKKIMMQLPYFFLLPISYCMGCLYQLPLIWNSQLCVTVCKPSSRPRSTMPSTKKRGWKFSFQCHSAQMYHERPMCSKTAWSQLSHVHGLIGISFTWHFSGHISFFLLIFCQVVRVLWIKFSGVASVARSTIAHSALISQALWIFMFFTIHLAN